MLDTPVKSAEMIIENQKISYVYHLPENPEISGKTHNKPLTVFLHGWGSSAQGFSSLFLKNTSFVALDFPGAGKSSPLQKIFTLEDYTRITQKFLEKFLQKNGFSKNQKIIAVGHSFGGRVIMKMLDMYPNFFSYKTLEKIIFIAVPFYREKTFQTELLGKIVKISNRILPKFLKLKLKKIAHMLIGENDYFDLADNEIMKKTFQNIVSEKSEISQYIPRLEQFSENQLFCFWGENDEIIPISFAYKVQQKIGKKFKIFSIPHSGHFPWVENSQSFFESWKSSSSQNFN